MKRAITEVAEHMLQAVGAELTEIDIDGYIEYLLDELVDQYRNADPLTRHYIIHRLARPAYAQYREEMLDDE